MKSCAEYIAEAKRALGDERMSDATFGAQLEPTFAQQTISKARRGDCTDGVALAVGEVLERESRRLARASGDKSVERFYAGEVLVAAHAERDADPAVRKALADYAKNVLGRLSQRVVSLLAGLTLAGGLNLWPHDAYALPGGAGGNR